MNDDQAVIVSGTKPQADIPAAGDPSAVAQSPGAIGELARFASELDAARVPQIVMDQAALCLLDTVACIVAGAGTPESRQVLAAERAAGVTGPSPVLTTRLRLPPEAAARVHGYWGDLFELNDLIGGHASIGIVPAALAAAAKYSSTGAELLIATVVGIEVASRIYAAVYPTLKSYTDVGMVTPGLVNAFGAAAAVARLAGFPASTLGNAMAIAGSLTTWCPAEVIFGDGGTLKPMLFGAAPAEAGLRAATYAEFGMTGPSRLLDSDLGLFPTLSRAEVPGVDAGWGEWHLARPRRKLHACCGYLHAAIDAAVELRTEIGRDTLRASRIEVRMPGYVLPAVSKHSPPATANQARFHAQYCLALAILGTDVITPAHSTRFQDYLSSEVMDVLDRIQVVGDPSLSHYHQCEVIARTPFGGTTVRRVDGPRGAPQNPLSDDEIRAKASRLLAGHVVNGETERYVRQFGDLASAPTVGWIADELEPTA